MAMPDFEVTALCTFTVRNVPTHKAASDAVENLEESIVSSELELRSPITATAVNVTRIEPIARVRRR